MNSVERAQPLLFLFFFLSAFILLFTSINVRLGMLTHAVLHVALFSSSSPIVVWGPLFCIAEYLAKGATGAQSDIKGRNETGPMPVVGQVRAQSSRPQGGMAPQQYSVGGIL